MIEKQKKRQLKIDKKIAKICQSGAKKYFTVFDCILYVVVIAIIICSTIFLFVFPQEKGNYFKIYYRGQEIAKYSLLEDNTYLFTIDTVGNGTVEKYVEGATTTPLREYNIIEVKEGKVKITETDCPDKTCQRTGAIDYGTIICLPHQLKITVIYEKSIVDA